MQRVSSQFQAVSKRVHELVEQVKSLDVKQLQEQTKAKVEEWKPFVQTHAEEARKRIIAILAALIVLIINTFTSTQERVPQVKRVVDDVKGLRSHKVVQQVESKVQPIVDRVLKVAEELDAKYLGNYVSAFIADVKEAAFPEKDETLVEGENREVAPSE